MTRKDHSSGDHTNFDISLSEISDEDYFYVENAKCDEPPADHNQMPEIASTNTLQQSGLLVNNIENPGLKNTSSIMGDGVLSTQAPIMRTTPQAHFYDRNDHPSHPAYSFNNPFSNQSLRSADAEPGSPYSTSDSSPSSTTTLLFTPVGTPASPTNHCSFEHKALNAFGKPFCQIPSPLPLEPPPYHPSTVNPLGAGQPHPTQANSSSSKNALSPLQINHLVTRLLDLSSTLQPLVPPSYRLDLTIRMHPARLHDHLDKNAFDVVEFCEWLASICLAACAPMRDGEVRELVGDVQRRFVGRETGKGSGPGGGAGKAGRKVGKGQGANWAEDVEGVIGRWEEFVGCMRSDIEATRQRIAAAAAAAKVRPTMHTKTKLPMR